MVGSVQWHCFISFIMESGSANPLTQPAQIECEFISSTRITTQNCIYSQKHFSVVVVYFALLTNKISQLVEPLAKSCDSTRICITVKRTQEHRAHMVGPLTISLGLAITCMIATLAAVLEPKIRLSHCRNRVTFWLQGLNTHIREYVRHSKPICGYSSHFRTLASILRFQHFSVFKKQDIACI